MVCDRDDMTVASVIDLKLAIDILDVTEVSFFFRFSANHSVLILTELIFVLCAEQKRDI